MSQSQIDCLIKNSPYEEPQLYWRYDRENRTFNLETGRRPAGYIQSSEHSRSFDDPGIFKEIPLVNRIRPRIKAWREAQYPGVTGITKRLLEHWHNSEARDYPFFFCQLEAIETLIWLMEGSPAEKAGINIPSDGGPFERHCCKMATGTGKTIVMAMLISWQVLNKVTYPQDKRFSKNIFIVAPGLTVKNRLQVLYPSKNENYYDQFRIVPTSLSDRLRQGKILVHNWHVLNWESEEKIAKKKSVDKRGAKSDEAYARDVLNEMSGSQNILVINDEAHHAWRVPAESKIKGVSKEDIDEATKWIGGLDRIHNARKILTCYDFSATPFVPTGKSSSEEALFNWIVSDFGLNDAIESGLVKTPRVVIRDDGEYSKDYKSRFYHLYMDREVHDNLDRKAEEHESLPDLVNTGYYLLGKDWLETSKLWAERNCPVPPVMISVVNRTETAARVKYAFDRQKIKIEELCDPERTLHIDSKVLNEAESEEEAQKVANAKENQDEEYAQEEDDGEVKPQKLTKKARAELLRQQVDTVGQQGKPGKNIQNVISVGMLSEGWDARTVTHIMGLRAFSSQLLCEQVVGRGLRRTSYDVNPETKLFEPEYVNIIGVPFTFLPHEASEGTPPPPPLPKTKIEPVPGKKSYEITWPNLVRVEHTYRRNLKLNLDKVAELELNASSTPTHAELAAMLEGKPNISELSEIILDDLAQKFRLQHIIFQTTRDIYDQMNPSWKGSREYLLAQLVALVEEFMDSGKIKIIPHSYEQNEMKKRVLFTLNMNKIVQEIWKAIIQENVEAVVPVFDTEQPIGSTEEMRPWFTGKPCHDTKKSHINFCVYDSTWEATGAFELDRNSDVTAWVKNDHLGFEIPYIHEGITHPYRPDFLVRLSSGRMLILEVKGQETEKDKSKRHFLEEWVKAVNTHGSFGQWTWGVSRNPADIHDIVKNGLMLAKMLC